MKTLILGIALILSVGINVYQYRTATHVLQQSEAHANDLLAGTIRMAEKYAHPDNRRTKQ